MSADASCRSGSKRSGSELGLGEDRQLADVAEDDVGGKEQDEHKGGLVDALLEDRIDVAAQEAFDEQEEDHAAVEDGEGKQVEDAEIEADGGHQLDHVLPPVALRGFPGLAGLLGDA